MPIKIRTSDGHLIEDIPTEFIDDFQLLREMVMPMETEEEMDMVIPLDSTEKEMRVFLDLYVKERETNKQGNYLENLKLFVIARKLRCEKMMDMLGTLIVRQTEGRGVLDIQDMLGIGHTYEELNKNDDGFDELERKAIENGERILPPRNETE